MQCIVMIIMFFTASVVLASLVTPVSDVHSLHTVASLLRGYCHIRLSNFVEARME